MTAANILDFFKNASIIKIILVQESNLSGQSLKFSFNFFSPQIIEEMESFLWKKGFKVQNTYLTSQ